MNRMPQVGAPAIIPRLCVALVLVYLLCHVDALFGPSRQEMNPRPEDPVGQTTFVENPRDMRVEKLASFIRVHYKTSTSVAYSAALASVQASNETGMPATLFLAVAGVESSFRPHADNGRDKGIMQVNPDWHPEKIALIGGAKNLFKVGPGLKTGARILKEYSVQKKGNVEQTLLKYNGARTMNDYPRKVLGVKRLLDAVLSRKAAA
jgi:soluble lytic murein transglycosylase-like protein